MAKTTTVQKIRDKFAVLAGLDKDNIISDDAEAFLELLNIAIDDAWSAAEWPFSMRVFPKLVDTQGLIDLSSDTFISQVFRAYDRNTRTTTSARTNRLNTNTVEDADVDGVYVKDAVQPVVLAVSSLVSTGTTATFTTTLNHNMITGDYAVIAGANETDYNGTFYITVVDATSFTYTMLADPVDTATGTITATKVTVFLETKIVTPEYTLLADTAPRRLESYLAYKTSADFLRGEGQEDRALKRETMAERLLSKEIDRLERQMDQQPPTIIGVRIAGRK